MFLLKLFGSKKLIATLAGVVATAVVPLVNAKLGAKLDPASVAGSIGAVAAVVLAYIAAQYRIDMSTNGDTTTSKLLERIAVGQTGPVPASVVAALHVGAAFVPAGPGRDAVTRALVEIGAE